MHQEQQDRRPRSTGAHHDQGCDPQGDELLLRGSSEEQPCGLREQDEGNNLQHSQQRLRHSPGDQGRPRRGQQSLGRLRLFARIGRWVLGGLDAGCGVFLVDLLEDTGFAHGTATNPVGLGMERGPVQPEITLERRLRAPGRQGFGGDPGIPARPVPGRDRLRQALAVGEFLNPPGGDVRSFGQREF